jgi:RNA polymerase sigma factor (sigma-70 family)
MPVRTANDGLIRHQAIDSAPRAGKTGRGAVHWSRPPITSTHCAFPMMQNVRQDRGNPRYRCPIISVERIAPPAQLMSIKITSVDDRARALLDLVAAGNQSAYEELYRLLSRRVYAFVRRMIENAESADEIMVDTMYEVWRTVGRYRGDSRVTTWILGIARNKVLMAMRSKANAWHEDIDDFADITRSRPRRVRSRSTIRCKKTVFTPSICWRTFVRPACRSSGCSSRSAWRWRRKRNSNKCHGKPAVLWESFVFAPMRRGNAAVELA